MINCISLIHKDEEIIIGSQGKMSVECCSLLAINIIFYHIVTFCDGVRVC